MNITEINIFKKKKEVMHGVGTFLEQYQGTQTEMPVHFYFSRVLRSTNTQTEIHYNYTDP